MKKTNKTLIALLIVLSACTKDRTASTVPDKHKGQQSLTVKEAIEWYNGQPDTSVLSHYPIRWTSAKSIPNRTANRIVLPIPGGPRYQNISQGYRQLSIRRSPETGQIEGRFIEVIPDALYFQYKRKVEQKDFTGRILVYDLDYHFEKGELYDRGIKVGISRPATEQEKNAHRDRKALSPLDQAFQQLPTTQGTGQAKTALARVTANCFWTTTGFIDGEGMITVLAEKFCLYDISEDGGDSNSYNDQGIDYQPQKDPNQGGGNNSPHPPEPSNLPGEQNGNVDPKKMVSCFASIQGPNAAYQVKVLVVEPLPGTFFNVGPNSFGHVAIQLTKTAGDQTITQTLGFYGSGTGLDKLVSPSTIKDNGDIAYNISASYLTGEKDFQKILDYIASPPRTYHYTDFNCAAFVYGAARAANLPVPDPTTTFGLFQGPGGSATGMSPAGMGSALRAEKAANPNANITQGGGTAPASKGECK